MPRYFFNVNDGSPSDPEGVELKDLATAKCEGVKMTGRLICESAGEFWNTQGFMMTVSNESGLTLFTLMCVGTEAAAIGALH